MIPLNQPEPQLVSITTLQRILDCGKTKIFELIKSGEIESVVCGGRRMAVYESVKAYVAGLRERARTETLSSGPRSVAPGAKHLSRKDAIEDHAEA